MLTIALVVLTCVTVGLLVPPRSPGTKGHVLACLLGSGVVLLLGVWLFDQRGWELAVGPATVASILYGPVLGARIRRRSAGGDRI